MSFNCFQFFLNLHLFFADNPYYFYNDPKSPCTPDSQSSSKGFSIFKRRNSKGNSPRVSIPEQTRLITSANLDTAATLTLGSPRSGFGLQHVSTWYSIHWRSAPHQFLQATWGNHKLFFCLQFLFQQSFELQPLMSHHQLPHHHQQITASLHQRRQRSSNSHSESCRDRLGSCSDASSTANHSFDRDDSFNDPTSPR